VCAELVCNVNITTYTSLHHNTQAIRRRPTY